MKTFTIIFTEEQINIVGNALIEGQFKVVAPVINDLNKQIQEQLNVPPKVEETPSA